MKRKIVIITGMSGSGKSTVAHTLEDAGFFCIDNLPIDLVPKLLELTETNTDEFFRLALVIDLRQRKFFPKYSEILDMLDHKRVSLEILFLEARDDVLVRRYSQTRRQHPMAPSGPVIDGIQKERRELAEIKQRANWIIDTSDMTVHTLREQVQRIFAKFRSDVLKTVVTSFGYGRGIPLGSDIVLDVRFLPNPYFVDELKDKSGKEPEVAQWLLSNEITRNFLEKLEDLLKFLLPLYIREGKQYLTISVGCTGGFHRSVVVAEYIAQFLKKNDYINVEVRHREMAT